MSLFFSLCLFHPVLLSEGHGLEALAEAKRGRLGSAAAHPGNVPGLESLSVKVGRGHLEEVQIQ